MSRHGQGKEKVGFKMNCDQVCESAPWSSRYGHAAVVFNGRLWILGGTETPQQGSQKNDVWSSADGITWREELDQSPWLPRWGHAVFNYRGKLWLIGGLADVNPIKNLNDLWSSEDGINWTLVNPDLPWVRRHVWSPLIHRNRMFLIAGATDGSNYYNDVFSSTDGNHWDMAKVVKPWFEKRKCLSAVSFLDKIWVAGGSILDPEARGGAYFVNDIWSSTDGNTWRCVSKKSDWSPRCFHQLVIYHDRIWLIGGEEGITYNYVNDIWSSVDGKKWRIELEHCPWPARHAAGVVVFNNKIWILGGVSCPPLPGDSKVRVGEEVYHNDIWTLKI